MQPLLVDGHGIIRFKRNAIIDFVLSWCAAQNGSPGYDRQPTPHNRAPDLNTLSLMNFEREDWVQLAQLLGYSVSGFGELSYVEESDYARADIAARKLKEQKV